MNGYLVFAVCRLDDIPVRLYERESDAIAAAKALKKPTENPLGTWDISGFVGAKVLRFVNGEPRGQALFFETEDSE